MNPYPSYDNNKPPNTGASGGYAQAPPPPLGFNLGFGGPGPAPVPGPGPAPPPGSQPYPPSMSHQPYPAGPSAGYQPYPPGAPQQPGSYAPPPPPATHQQPPYNNPLQQPYPGASNYPNQAPPPPYGATSQPPHGTFVPAQQPQQPQQNRDQLFRSLVQKYEIGHDYANRMQLLAGYKIVFIFDDSSSMNSQLSDSPLLARQSRVTRWNELEYFASISIELANCFDQSGCDVYFLNKQPPIRNIRNTSDFLNVFRDYQQPRGYTPLTRALDQVLRDNLQLVNYERKLLILIVTDGEPTDDRGNSDISGFKRCLESRKPADRIFTSIIACTDQDDSMEYLNRMDRTLKNLDVVDDFRNEKKEVTRTRGSSFPFSYGDYVVKAMIGSVDKTIDAFDEKKKSKHSSSGGSSGGFGLFKKLLK